MKPKISGSSTYTPVFTVSLNTSPQEGFSRKRSMEPSSRVITMPNSSGLSMALRPMVTRASFSSWKATTLDRSVEVSTSPEISRNRSSSLSRALSTEPAVPMGVSSVA